MHALSLIAQVVRSNEVPGMPKIIFWLLLLLWAIGTFGFADNPHIVRGSAAVQIILFGILGYYLFSF